MCQVLLIAADSELPPVEWDEEAPGFHIGPMADADRAYYPMLTKAYAYEVGSSLGCACGFGVHDDAILTEQQKEQNAEAYAERAALRVYLAAAAATSGAVELLVCWPGDQDEIGPIQTVCPGDITESFDLDGPAIYLVTEDRARVP